MINWRRWSAGTCGQIMESARDLMLPSPPYPFNKRYQRVTPYYRRRGKRSWFYSGFINGISRRSTTNWRTSARLSTRGIGAWQGSWWISLRAWWRIPIGRRNPPWVSEMSQACQYSWY